MKKAARFICAIAAVLFSVSLLVKTVEAESQKELLPVIKNYRIHADDVLDISVWGVEGLTKTVTVRPDGKISFPLIGDIFALGKTTEQLSFEMEEALAEYVKESDVTIVLLSFHKPTVYILGEIKSPGSYDLTEPFMLLQLLAQAKLVRPGINEHSVAIIREGKSTDVSLDITQKKGMTASNFRLEDGDVIYVSHRAVASVNLQGAGGRSSKYPIPSNPANIAEILAEAGELNEYTIRYGVKLIRGTEVMQISLSEPPEDFKLKHNDVIYVPPTKKGVITVTGYVKTPGVYSFVRGYTLLDMIQQAGGFDSKGSMDHIKIFRDYPDGTQIIKAGDLYNPETNPPALLPGDLIYIDKRKSSPGQFVMKRLLPAVRDVTIISSLLDN